MIWAALACAALAVMLGFLAVLSYRMQPRYKRK